MSKRSPIQFAIAICLVLVTCTLSLYFLTSATVRETRRTAASFAEAVKNTFNFTPRVTVDRTLIFRESTPVMELITNKERFEHRMQWSSTWLGSTKTIELKAFFTASAGFDLHEPFSVAFDSRKQTVRIRHPRPRILSVQLDTVIASQDAPGWWNSITDADRTEVLNRFTADARNKIETTAPALERAEANLRKQLGDLLAKSGLKVEFEETTGTPTPPPAEHR